MFKMTLCHMRRKLILGLLMAVLLTVFHDATSGLSMAEAADVPHASSQGLLGAGVSLAANQDRHFTVRETTYGPEGADEEQSESVLTTSPSTLMEETFDNIPDGQLPIGWEKIEGDFQVRSGALVGRSLASVSPARILLPPGIEGDGNVIFETDMTFLSVVEPSRWASLMYRIQSMQEKGHYPYYQFAFRQGATAANGIEFAYRTPQNSWDVREKTSHSTSFAINQTYHMKVVASRERVRQYVDGELLLDTDRAGEHADGRLGFQANGVQVRFDNVKVTLNPPLLPPITSKAKAYQPIKPNTNLVFTPDLAVTEVESLEQLMKLANQGTTTVWLKIKQNNDGQLEAYSGNYRIGLLSDVLHKLKGNFIPMLEPAHTNEAQAIGKLLQEEGIQDAHLASSDLELLRSIRQKDLKLRRAYTVTATSLLTEGQLGRISMDAHSVGANIVVLPQAVSTQENVHYLAVRGLASWVLTDNSDLGIHAALVSGARGIVTSQPAKVRGAWNVYPKVTLLHRPILIAHRGAPQVAPEDTLASYEKAIQLGSEVMENDIRRTADGELVLLHDETVHRTTNGTGFLRNMTLQEVKKLDAGSWFGPSFKGERIPTLREALRQLKGRPVIMLAEPKEDGLEAQIIQIIKEEGVESQVLIQSFNDQHLRHSRDIEPAYGRGLLESQTPPLSAALDKAMKQQQYYTALQSMSAPSFGSMYPELAAYGGSRGLTFWTWTVNDLNKMKQLISLGVHGIITDLMHQLKDDTVRVQLRTDQLELKIGHAFQPVIERITRDGRKVVVEAPSVKWVVVQPVNSLIQQVNPKTGLSELVASSPGKAIVMAAVTGTAAGGTWQFISAPVEVQVSP